MSLRIVLPFLCIAYFTSYSQNLKKIDSLQNAVSRYDTQKSKNGKAQIIPADTVKINLLNDIADSYCFADPTKSIIVSQQSLALASNLKYEKGIMDAYFTIGIAHAGKGDFQKAIQYFNLARDLCIKNHNRELLSKTYNELGIVFAKQGNFPESLKNSLAALHIYEELKNRILIANAYANIGILYKQQEKYKEALDNYSRSLEILKSENNEDADYSRCCIQNGIGQVYLKQGKYTASLQVLTAALEAATKFGDPYFDADTNLTIGKNYYFLANYPKAQQYYAKALQLFGKIQEKSGEADCYIHIGLCNFKQGIVKEAIVTTNKGLEIGKEIGQLEWIKNAYNNLSEIYSSEGNYKLAYQNHVLYKQINDSLFNSEKDKKFTQLQMTNDFEDKQQIQKIQQQKKDALLQMEADKQRNTKYIVIGALCFMSLLTLGVYNNLKRNQKQRRIIEEQKAVVESKNEQIRNSLTEKETLLREIHHRVKNNLQIISSLLNIQSQDIKDENVLSSIQEGQSRVQAMSLIHQNLYQSEHINNVNIESYLNELVAYLSTLFIGNSKLISVAIETSGLHFDIDTAIPLGLIVNELVSNAYKYAFDANKEGTIQIIIKPLKNMDYQMEVNNNGKELPADFDASKTKSLGLKLVSILSRQLRGSVKSGSDNGITSFKVIFKDLKLYQASLD